MKNKILAVDDDVHIVRLVKVNLERAGYQVNSAYDGKEALESIYADPPDLLICDVMMPTMSGFQVVRQLKSDPSTEYIPIIMLTARSGDTDVADGWVLGADVYLTKPFNPPELLSFVQRFLPLHNES